MDQMEQVIRSWTHVLKDHTQALYPLAQWLNHHIVPLQDCRSAPWKLGQTAEPLLIGCPNIITGLVRTKSISESSSTP